MHGMIKVCDFRYFTKQDLRELFVLDDTRNSVTQQQLSELHANQRKTDTSLDAHVAFLHTLGAYTNNYYKYVCVICLSFN